MDENKKEKKKGGLIKKVIIGIVIIIVAVVVLSRCAACGQSNSSLTDETMGQIKWPNSSIAKLLPVPKSLIGSIDYDSEDSLDVDIQTSKSDYQEYVNECKNKGFTVDYTSYGDSYSASDSNGNEISLRYDEDENTMSITAHSATEDEGDDEEYDEDSDDDSQDSDSEKPAPKSSKKAEKKDGVNAKFKKTMDDYEKFMNKYVDFMKKYKKNPNDVNLLSEYTEIMDKYADWVSKIDDIDEDSLGSADAAYYIKVTNRVTKKLAEVE